MEYNKFLKEGYIIVDDFLPQDEALKLESLYSNNSDWSLADQVRDDLYTTSHFQSARTKSKYLPKENESYSARFWSSVELVSQVEKIHDKYFKPLLKEISSFELSEYNVRCYKMEKELPLVEDYIGHIFTDTRLNSRKYDPWQTYYDSETKEKVNEKYKEDFKRFNYDEHISM